MALLSQTSNNIPAVDDEKGVSPSPVESDLITASVNLTTKVETRDNVDLWGSHITQCHPEVLGTTVKSPDKVRCTAKPNSYSNGRYA